MAECYCPQRLLGDSSPCQLPLLASHARRERSAGLKAERLFLSLTGVFELALLGLLHLPSLRNQSKVGTDQ